MPNTLDFVPLNGDHFFFLAYGDKIANIIKNFIQNTSDNTIKGLK